MSEIRHENTYLVRAIQMVGSQNAFAERCGVTQQAVSKWLRKGVVPIDKTVLAEQAVGGKITKEQFRPDFFTSTGQQ